MAWPENPTPRGPGDGRAGTRTRRPSPRSSPRRTDFAAALGIVLVAALLMGSADTVTPTAPEPPPGPETCSDTLDNDADGLVDMLDPECDPADPAFDGIEDGTP